MTGRATPHHAANEDPRSPGKCRGGFKSGPAMAQVGRTYPCPVCGRMVRVTAYGWYYHHKPKVTSHSAERALDSKDTA